MLTFVVMLIFIGLAAALAWFFLANDHGEKEPVLALWWAAGLGLIGAYVAAILEGHLAAANALVAGSSHTRMLSASMVVGGIEELCKFLPLALIIYNKRYFNEHTDGIIYFALAGLGFGLPENLLYTMQFGSKAGLIRVLLTPLFHAATTGIVGYFLIRRKLSHKPVWGIAGALVAMVLLHGLYDFGLSSGVMLYTDMSLMITLCLSAGLFYLFNQATELDQARGLSAAGHNSFCRSCGFPNPKHHLYCIHCGSHA